MCPKILHLKRKPLMRVPRKLTDWFPIVGETLDKYAIEHILLYISGWLLQNNQFLFFCVCFSKLQTVEQK